MIAAARYLGVAPWELEEQEICWMDRALIAQSAENWAESEAMAHARSRAFMSQKAN